MNITSPVLRYHGGKFRLAPWVMQFFPAHTCYVEPFGGAAGVLIQKPRSYAEVYNDLDGDVANLFQVLRNPAQRAELIDQIQLTPYSRDEFTAAWLPSVDPVERARRLVIRAQMGFGSAGATKGSTGFRIDTRRSYGTAQHLWARYPEQLALVGERLAGVLIENRSAVDVIRGQDRPETLFYVDPPYVLGTRVRAHLTGRCYRHEMSDQDHVQLLSTLRSCAGMVVVSGYWSALYDEALSDWERHETDARISAGRGTALRREVVWLNKACSNGLREVGLFAGVPA
ncbi:DNA adenine methylase [Andreprevotia chitinilytica]|uniref:DNA adenine methylase n=1 Tax=Andreprevotia chitinilytica TaxID=396808 RepID=UPI000556E8D1|nr:DNA adenine methylase [Andreprevotia chitinilytica]